MQTLSLALLLPVLGLATHLTGPACDEQGTFDRKGYELSHDEDISVTECQQRCANHPHCLSVAYDSDDECTYFPVSIRAKSFKQTRTGKYRVWERVCTDIKNKEVAGSLFTTTWYPPNAARSLPTGAAKPSVSLSEVLADPHLFEERDISQHCAAAGHLRHDDEILSEDMDDEIACASSCSLKKDCKSYSFRYNHESDSDPDEAGVHCKAYSKTIEEQQFVPDGDSQHHYFDRNCAVVAIIRANGTADASNRKVPKPPVRRPGPALVCSKRGHSPAVDAAFRAQLDRPPLPDSFQKINCRDSCNQNSTCQAFAYGISKNQEAQLAICVHLPKPVSQSNFTLDTKSQATFSDKGCPLN